MGEIIIGIVSGMVAALGMGGGTILILLLGIFTELKQHIIQGSNLIFFIPTSIVAIIMNVKNKFQSIRIKLSTRSSLRQASRISRRNILRRKLRMMRT